MAKKKQRIAKPLPTIGWREWVGLPDLGVSAIKAKIDTGARSSSLHAFDVRVVRRGDQRYVRFKVHPIQRDGKTEVEAIGKLIDKRQVRSSSGHADQRPVILTEVDLNGESWPIELTLTNRDEMGFRMLLGRQAIRGRYLVDAERSYLLSQSPFRKRKRKKTRLKGNRS